MDTKNQPSFYKPAADSAERKRGLLGRNWDFLTPYVVSTFLVFPSLAVLAIFKRTVSFGALSYSDYYALMISALWLFVPLSVLFGVMYIVTGRNKTVKAFVGLLSAVTVAAFVYVLVPGL